MPKKKASKKAVVKRVARKAQEASVFLRQGKQTIATKRVIDYANMFPGKSLRTVKAIVGDISKFKRRRFLPADLKLVYAKRTADEILDSRYVALAGGKRKQLGSFAAAEGCLDYNIVLCSVLRAKGIPAKFTRDGLHSTTVFFADGKWFEADPTNSLVRRLAVEHVRRGGLIDASKLPELVNPLTEKRLEDLRLKKKLGFYAEGPDAWSIGIRSLNDFFKYGH